jgi:hypothetical protein
MGCDGDNERQGSTAAHKGKARREEATNNHNLAEWVSSSLLLMRFSGIKNGLPGGVFIPIIE